jgi:hypothetical protein
LCGEHLTDRERGGHRSWPGEAIPVPSRRPLAMAREACRFDCGEVGVAVIALSPDFNLSSYENLSRCQRRRELR